MAGSAARERAVQADRELATWKDTQRDLDSQMRDLSSRIQTAERDLMSGRVRNPKELEGMQANLEALKRRRSHLEDDDLEAMLEIERCQATAEARRAGLVAEETRSQAAQARLADDLSRSVAELKTLAARFTRQWEAISPEDKEYFRTLRQRKGGRAPGDRSPVIRYGGPILAFDDHLPRGIQLLGHRAEFTRERLVADGEGQTLRRCRSRQSEHEE